MFILHKLVSIHVQGQGKWTSNNLGNFTSKQRFPEIVEIIDTISIFTQMSEEHSSKYLISMDSNLGLVPFCKK